MRNLRKIPNRLDSKQNTKPKILLNKRPSQQRTKIFSFQSNCFSMTASYGSYLYVEFVNGLKTFYQFFEIFRRLTLEKNLIFTHLFGYEKIMKCLSCCYSICYIKKSLRVIFHKINAWQRRSILNSLRNIILSILS